MHRGADEHQVKMRSFAFAVDYIYCFRTYSVYLSLRLPAQILYAGIHLCPLAVLRSCFGYSLSHLRTAAACLSRCIRHRRRSKAKPLRGRRGRCRAVHRFTAVRPTFSLFTLTFYLRRQPHWGSQEPRLVTPLQVLTKKRAGKTCALLFVLCSFYESTFALRSGWRLIAAWQLFMISASVTLYLSIMDATLAVSLRMSTTTTCS